GVRGKPPGGRPEPPQSPAEASGSWQACRLEAVSPANRIGPGHHYDLRLGAITLLLDPPAISPRSEWIVSHRGWADLLVPQVQRSPRLRGHRQKGILFLGDSRLDGSGLPRL